MESARVGDARVGRGPPLRVEAAPQRLQVDLQGRLLLPAREGAVERGSLGVGPLAEEVVRLPERLPAPRPLEFAAEVA